MENQTIKCFDLIKKLCTYLLRQNKQCDFVLLCDGFSVVELDDDLFLDLITDMYKDVYLVDGDVDLDILEKEEWDEVLFEEMDEELQENAKVIQLKNDNRQVIFIEYEH